MSERPLPPGLVSASELSFEEQEAIFARYLRPSYPHHEIFGHHCPLSAHVDAPFDAVVDYCAHVPSLAEWTLNLRHLEPVTPRASSQGPDGSLHRGKMIFSRDDAAAPTTDIYIRADVLRGPEHALVCYPCAWDQQDQLWMRYFFVVSDAAHTLGEPGTVIAWNNHRHRFYNRESAAPAHIAAPRARTDRPWAGDGWPLFYALHRIELDNLQAILEHRHAGWR